MNSSRLEWKVGLFVLIGLVLLAVLLLQFSKGTTLFQPVRHILLHTTDISGLKPRAQVLMSGVQVGSVSDITLSADGRSVTITLAINRKHAIHKDARFTIESSGFLGDQYVAIIPTVNKAPVFEEGGVADCAAPFNLQEVARAAGGFIKRVDLTASNLNLVIGDVRQELLNDETLTNMAVAIANLRVVSEHALSAVDSLRTLVTSNSPSISLAGSNLVAFTEHIDQAALSLNDVVSTNAPVINAAVKNIESSTEVLKTLLDDVQAGKGTAGALLTNDEIATNIAHIAENLSITTSNLNRMGLWGILWKKKAPHTNAAPAAIVAPKKRSR